MPIIRIKEGSLTFEVLEDDGTTVIGECRIPGAPGGVNYEIQVEPRNSRFTVQIAPPSGSAQQ